MKTAVKLSALSALLLALASAAHADTINLGSYGTGDSANGAGNSALVYAGYNSSTPSTALSLSGTGTTYELTHVSPWSGPILSTIGPLPNVIASSSMSGISKLSIGTCSTNAFLD